MRGLRLNLLTNTPYSLIIYAVQRKIYYTEVLPSCPVLFLFFSKLFLRGLFLRVNCKSNFTELNACEPRAGRFGKSGRAAGTVRARLPARPLISVSGREPCTENSEMGGPGAGTVCVRLPARPLFSVYVRKPRTVRFGNGGPAARFAPQPPLGLIPSFRGANSSHNFRPESAISPAARPAGLLPSPR